MHGRSAAASSAKSPVAATRTRKSVYARVVGAMGSRSSAAGRDAELRGIRAVEVHLGPGRGLQEVGEARQRVEIGRPRRRETEQAAVLDEEPVVLPHPVPEALEVERAVADAPDERMRVLGLPDRVRQAPEARREGLAGRDAAGRRGHGAGDAGSRRRTGSSPAGAVPVHSVTSPCAMPIRSSTRPTVWSTRSRIVLGRW